MLDDEDQPTWAEDPLVSLARELRQTVGAELRAEAEAVENEVEISRLRRRTSSELAREAARRGDRVSLVSAARTVSGTLVHVGRDYVSVETAAEHVDARLDRIALVVSPNASGGFSPSGGSITFKARLSEYEQTGESVELIATGLSFSVSGAIQVVAADHVIVCASGGVRTSLPLELIDLVLRKRLPRSPGRGHSFG